MTVVTQVTGFFMAWWLTSGFQVVVTGDTFIEKVIMLRYQLALCHHGMALFAGSRNRLEIIVYMAIQTEQLFVIAVNNKAGALVMIIFVKDIGICRGKCRYWHDQEYYYY